MEHRTEKWKICNLIYYCIKCICRAFNRCTYGKHIQNQKKKTSCNFQCK